MGYGINAFGGTSGVLAWHFYCRAYSRMKVLANACLLKGLMCFASHQKIQAGGWQGNDQLMWPAQMFFPAGLY
jgi:hypothetical protein